MEHSTKFYLSFILSLISFDSSNGQILHVLKSFDEVEVGFGPNLYRIHNSDPSTRIELKPGFTGMTNLLYNVRPSFLISTRLFFDHKGYIDKYETEYYDSSTGLTKTGIAEGETYLNSTGAGILARLKIKRTRFYFETGPFATYFIKGSLVKRHSWDNLSYKSKIEGDNRISGGISLAVGYRVPIGEAFGLNLLLIENLNLLDNIHDTVTFQIGINYHKPNNLQTK